jgi:hypothetical protein
MASKCILHSMKLAHKQYASLLYPLVSLGSWKERPASRSDITDQLMRGRGVTPTTHQMCSSRVFVGGAAGADRRNLSYSMRRQSSPDPQDDPSLPSPPPHPVTRIEMWKARGLGVFM